MSFLQKQKQQKIISLQSLPPSLPKKENHLSGTRN